MKSLHQMISNIINFIEYENICRRFDLKREHRIFFCDTFEYPIKDQSRVFNFIVNCITKQIDQK
jgi:hypothetical protein